MHTIETPKHCKHFICWFFFSLSVLPFQTNKQNGKKEFVLPWEFLQAFFAQRVHDRQYTLLLSQFSNALNYLFLSNVQELMLKYLCVCRMFVCMFAKRNDNDPHRIPLR